MKASSTARVAEIKAASEEFLQSVAVQGRLHHARKYVTFTGVARTLSPSTSTYLSDNLAYILVCEAGPCSSICNTRVELIEIPYIGDVRMLRLHVFHLNDEEPAEEVTDDDEQITTSQQWTLPCREFDGLWERCVAGSIRHHTNRWSIKLNAPPCCTRVRVACITTIASRTDCCSSRRPLSCLLIVASIQTSSHAIGWYSPASRVHWEHCNEYN